jgi:uncharacterized protein (TIGR02271 family)
MMEHLNMSREQNARFPESMTDVRGFEVRTQSDNEKVGRVDDLVCSPDGRLRYLDVDAGGFFNAHRVALPIGAAEVDRTNDVVWVRGMSKDQIKDLPEYSGDASSITDDYEKRVRRSIGSSPDRSDSELYDQGRFYAERGGESAREARLILSEEELHVGKRSVKAGEAGLRKTVESKHVEETVPLVHEEVTVERRPITDRNARGATISEGEVRIPLMAEEAVVEKRAVAKEEVVLSKKQVTENKTVGADVQRERLDESGLHATTRNVADRVVRGDVADETRAGREASRTDRSLGEKIADKADDLKDRVDGNPRSRPGPDATDRR